jgi:hypothetical protein
MGAEGGELIGFLFPSSLEILHSDTSMLQFVLEKAQLESFMIGVVSMNMCLPIQVDPSNFDRVSGYLSSLSTNTMLVYGIQVYYSCEPDADLCRLPFTLT